MKVAIITVVERPGGYFVKTTRDFSDPQSLRLFWKKTKKRTRNQKVTFCAINKKYATPIPSNLYISRHISYCPYCIAARRFPLDQHTGVDCCEICGVSENEYYVKKYNER